MQVLVTTKLILGFTKVGAERTVYNVSYHIIRRVKYPILFTTRHFLQFEVFAFCYLLSDNFEVRNRLLKDVPENGHAEVFVEVVLAQYK